MELTPTTSLLRAELREETGETRALRSGIMPSIFLHTSHCCPVLCRCSHNKVIQRPQPGTRRHHKGPHRRLQVSGCCLPSRHREDPRHMRTLLSRFRLPVVGDELALTMSAVLSLPSSAHSTQQSHSEGFTQKHSSRLSYRKKLAGS